MTDRQRLIIAAPILLRACELLVAHYPRLPAPGTGVDIAELARSAVDDIRGRFLIVNAQAADDEAKR